MTKQKQKQKQATNRTPFYMVLQDFFFFLSDVITYFIPRHKMKILCPFLTYSNLWKIISTILFLYLYLHPKDIL